MQRMKIRWIGLKISPHLQLGLQEGRDEAEEYMEWIEIERNACFYPQGGTTYDEPWDVKEFTKAMKELHMHD